jgi:ornithine cyclodeaminase/alanine dehydrogenase-like protein (mu-crystallin family)
VHINAIGADLIGKSEVPVPVLKAAFVTPDHLAQALREGECQQLEEGDVGPDLMTLCADPETAARHRDGVTVFDSTGSGLRTTWPSTCCSNSPRRPASAIASRSSTCRTTR